MKKEFIFLMFALCFGVWAIVVDTFIVPASGDLDTDSGAYTRYRVKEWKGDGKLDLLKDKLIIYAQVKGRERFYYMDRTSYFEATLRAIPAGSSVEMRYVRSFPKVWQRTLQEVRLNGVPALRYSRAYIEEKQKFIYQFTAIIIGVFVALSSLAYISKPPRRK